MALFHLRLSMETVPSRADSAGGRLAERPIAAPTIQVTNLVALAVILDGDTWCHDGYMRGIDEELPSLVCRVTQRECLEFLIFLSHPESRKAI